LWPPPSVAFGATFPRKREKDPTAPSERAERVFFALCPNEPKRAHSSNPLLLCALSERAQAGSFVQPMGLTLITSESGQIQSAQNATALNSSLPKMLIV